MWLCPVPYIPLTRQLNAGSPLDDSGGGLVLDRDRSIKKKTLKVMKMSEGTNGKTVLIRHMEND